MDKFTRAIEKAGPAAQAPADIPDTGHLQGLPRMAFSVPAERLLANRLVSTVPGHPEAAYYKLLRTRVLSAADANGWRLLGIAAVEPGQGGSLTAANLSLAIADTPGRSVILIDGHFRQPGLAGLFGITPTASLSEYLLQERPMSELACTLGLANHAVILEASRRVIAPEQWLSPAMEALLDTLKSEKDALILVDLPPVFAGDEVLLALERLDAVILVLDARKTTTARMQQALERLEGCHIAACVLNHASDH